MKRTPEESAFMGRGGYGLLKMFNQGEQLRADFIVRKYGGLANEALKLNLIVMIDPKNQTDRYFIITRRGIELRDN